jgi:hypothetical protein
LRAHDDGGWANGVLEQLCAFIVVSKKVPNKEHAQALPSFRYRHSLTGTVPGEPLGKWVP